MTPNPRKTTHPGLVLLHEFLEPLGLSQKALAGHLGVAVQRVNEIIRGKRGVSAGMAWLLSEAFSTSPVFWLNLQTIHDLSAKRPARHVEPIVAA